MSSQNDFEDFTNASKCKKNITVYKVHQGLAKERSH